MSDWKLFSQEKPNEGQLVYTYCKRDGRFNIGYYEHEYMAAIDFDSFEIDATHWMPLPEAPKGD